MALEEEKRAGIALQPLVLIPGHILPVGVDLLAENQAGALLDLLFLVPAFGKDLRIEVKMVGRRAQEYAISTLRQANVPTGTNANTDMSRLLGL